MGFHGFRRLGGVRDDAKSSHAVLDPIQLLAWRKAEPSSYLSRKGRHD
jgi:hypothetical protein